MIPEQFAQIEEIPVTSNGKTDRRKLLSIQSNLGTGSVFEEPSSEEEEKMLAVWKKVLRKESISINDNFFSLGGQSLKAILLISEISQVFGKELSIEKVFKNATIKELVRELQNSKSSQHRSIPKAKEKEYYEASSAQKRMYMIYQQNQMDTSYNVPDIVVIKQELNKDKVESSIRKLIERHEILRTSYALVDGEIVQKVEKDFNFILSYCENSNNIREKIKKSIQPFDLRKVPLVNAILIKEEEQKYYLMLDIPHIATDGISNQILWNEFWALYNENFLEEPIIQYKDYALWQNERIRNGQIKQQKEYWMNLYKDGGVNLSLITDFARPKIQSHKGAVVSLVLNEKHTKEIKEIAFENKVTLYMILFSAFNILLSKYTRQEDIIIGTPVVGRVHTDLDNVVGMFVNTLALRNSVRNDLSFKELLNVIRENTLNAFSNQEFSFDDLVEQLHIPIDLSRNPIFDVMFVYQNNEHEANEKNSKVSEERDSLFEQSKVDISLITWESNNEIHFCFEYCTELYNQETIQFMGNHLIEILLQIISNENVAISNINMLTKVEKRMINEFNCTDFVYNKKETVLSLLDITFKTKQKQVAIIDGTESIMYEQLDELSDKVAQKLIELGVANNTIVGVYTQKNKFTYIAIFAILKAGGAYMPIDINTPKERVSYMIKDSKCPVVLTYRSSIRLEGVINLDLDEKEIYDTHITSLDVISSAEDTCYVIYTSGSTGEPKGVLVSNQNVVNFCLGGDNGVYAYFKREKVSRIASVTSCAFDIFVTESLFAIVHGMTVILANKFQEGSGKAFSKLIVEKNIEVLQTTPSRLKMYLEDIEFQKSISMIKIIIFGGESIDASFIQRLRCYAKHTIINEYGPTETTIAVTRKEITDIQEELTNNIGKPYSNTKIYVMKDQTICGIGIPGELCIGGDCVTKGYLNNANMNEERFSIDPFGEGRMYRSGDLVRWLPSGELQFLGRLNDTIKLRGYRIDLGEIESRISNVSAIKRNCVIIKKDRDNYEYLCAYVVCEDNLTSQQIKEYIGGFLPFYMIPDKFIRVNAIYITANGKVDRQKLLSENNELESGIDYIEPKTETQKKLMNILQDILGKDNISIYDDFYSLGVSSIKLVRLATDIIQAFRVEITIEEIRKYASIRDISIFIDNTRRVRENNFSNIIAFTKNDTNKNVFMIHDVSGDVNAYSKLCSCLNIHTNVYGIASLFNTVEPQVLHIKKMASVYLKQISKIQKEEGVVLFGWSAGGLIALEIARQCELAGRIVDRVILLDTHMSQSPQIPTQITLENEKTFIKQLFDMKFAEFNCKSIKQLWRDVTSSKQIISSDIKLNKMYKRLIDLSNFNSNEEVYKKINMIRSIEDACKRFKLEDKINAPIYYFKASEEKHHQEKIIQKYTNNKFEVIEVKGNHYSILSDENIQELGDVLYSVLDKTE
ncbi:MAG: amino acid adenylation domain-containing protein [Anaerocolumna jejuensis]